MISTVLYLNIYQEQNEARRKELEICYKNNLLSGFDEIWLVVESKDEQYALDLMERYTEGQSTIHLKVISERPAFQTFIDISRRYNNTTIHSITNSDIFIEPEDLQKLKDIPWNKKLFVALSRYELTQEGAFLLDRPDTADWHTFKGYCEVDDAHCPQGFAGSDNSIAYKFQSKGYKVVNPSRSIRVNHLHNVLGNNYRVNGTGEVIAKFVCPEPYAFHPPIKSDEI